MIISDTEAREGAVLDVQRPPEPPFAPSPGARGLLSAAARVQNTVASAGVALGSALERRQIRARQQLTAEEIDPDYNPLADIGGYERHARAFRDAESRDEVIAIKRRIDREIEDRKLLDAAGIEGVAAQIATGTLDP